jgi:hypothetical protein
LIGYLCSGLQDQQQQPAGMHVYSSQRSGGAANTSEAQKEMQRRSRLCLFDTTPVRDMTLRQLRDSVQNLQVNWVSLSVAETMQPQAMEAVDALFHRFGVLASQVQLFPFCSDLFITLTFSVLFQAWPASIMDDQGSIEQASVPKKKHQQQQQQQQDQYDAHASSSSKAAVNNELKMTRICMRRFVNVFLALHRRMHLWNHRTDIQADVGNLAQGDFDCGIKLHHILAASDDFSKLSMYWDLMPAAKLNYIHDFRGYFNCISQVVYFHDQEYERRPQVSCYVIFSF